MSETSKFQPSTAPDLFEKKIEMIKFFRTLSNSGLVEAKDIVEWFLENCPLRLNNWSKIQALAVIANKFDTGEVVFKNGELYTTRKVTLEEMVSEYGLHIVASGSVDITKLCYYEFPQY